MVAMNLENNRRENEASSHQNNDDLIGDEAENNIHNTRGRKKTFQTTTTQGPSIYSKPFSECIMSLALPENFQLLMTLKPYDGTRDPQVHVTMFRLMMLVNGVSDLFLYKTFPTFLEKAALLWFSSLPVGTIHNFAKLSQAFVNSFSSSRVCKKFLDSLNAIWQGLQELLKEYLDQFNTMVMQIQYLDLAVDLHSIKRGLWVGSFVDSLAIHLPRSLTKFMDQAVGTLTQRRSEKQAKRKLGQRMERRKVKAKSKIGKKESDEIGTYPQGEGPR